MAVLERERIGLKDSDAFRIEYNNTVSDQVIFDDVVSYLGEYRFNLPKYNYSLKFSDNKLRDPNRNDAMVDEAQRAIELKIREGRRYDREVAEKIGFQSLDRKLELAKTNDTIVWASPSGPKEEGYGDYGFIYFGKVEEVNENEKNIKMTAIRVENPSIYQFREVIQMLTGDEINFYTTAGEFLANPRLEKRDIQERDVDAVLKKVFDFSPSTHERDKFDRIIHEMFPLISDFVKSAKNPWKTKSEKLKELYSLENYALELKTGRSRNKFGMTNTEDSGLARMTMRDAVREYGFEPPKVGGSCRGTSSDRSISSNLFSKRLGLNSMLDTDGEEWFRCPKCNYKADGPIGDGPCPGCGLTKEEFAESGGEVCN